MRESISPGEKGAHAGIEAGRPGELGCGSRGDDAGVVDAADDAAKGADGDGDEPNVGVPRGALGGEGEGGEMAGELGAEKGPEATAEGGEAGERHFVDERGERLRIGTEADESLPGWAFGLTL